MASLIHPTLCQVNQFVFPRLMLQLARPPNPVRVDIRSPGLPFRSIFSDTAPSCFIPRAALPQSPRLSLRARVAPRSAGAAFRRGVASGGSWPAAASSATHASPAARPSSPIAAASSSGTKRQIRMVAGSQNLLKGRLVAGGGFVPQPRIDSVQLTDSTIVWKAKKGYKGKSFIQFSFSFRRFAFPNGGSCS